MRTLVGIALLAVGVSQLLLATGLLEARMTDLWSVGAIGFGLWLLASGLRRPDRGGSTVGFLALMVTGYHLGWQVLAWPVGLSIPPVLLAPSSGVVVMSILPAKTARNPLWE